MRLRTRLIAAGACAALLGVTAVASAQISISINLAPPVLPVYEQPDIPASGYLWVPGYWAWESDAGYYYWVPGTWVLPPEEGLLWTPGYWGWNDGAYLWHEGYWGHHVGYYGGVDYGYGYGPHGYDGGRWDHGRFYYNTAANRIPPNAHLAYIYHHPMEGGGRPSHVSFNGGAGGIDIRATPAQLSAGHEGHIRPIAAQRQLVQSASHDRQLRADYNHGHPGTAATPRPGAFSASHGEAAHAPGGDAGHDRQTHQETHEGGASAAIEHGPGPSRSHSVGTPGPAPEQRAPHETVAPHVETAPDTSARPEHNTPHAPMLQGNAHEAHQEGNHPSGFQPAAHEAAHPSSHAAPHAGG